MIRLSKTRPEFSGRVLLKKNQSCDEFHSNFTEHGRTASAISIQKRTPQKPPNNKALWKISRGRVGSYAMSRVAVLLTSYRLDRGPRGRVRPRRSRKNDERTPSPSIRAGFQRSYRNRVTYVKPYTVLPRGNLVSKVLSLFFADTKERITLNLTSGTLPRSAIASSSVPVMLARFPNRHPNDPVPS